MTLRGSGIGRKQRHDTGLSSGKSKTKRLSWGYQQSPPREKGGTNEARLRAHHPLSEFHESRENCQPCGCTIEARLRAIPTCTRRE